MKVIIFSLILFFITSITYSQSGWVQQSSGTTLSLFSIYFIDYNTGWTVGDSGKILKTSNGGASWFQQNSNTTRPLSGVNFSNANNGTAFGNYYQYNPWCFDNVIRLLTSNGGSTWSILYEGYGLKINDFVNVENNIMYLASEGVDQCMISTGSISKTSNNGINWIYCQTPPPGFGYKSVSFIDSQTGWATGMYFTDYGLRIRQLIKTINGGKFWQIISRDSNAWGIPNGKIRFVNTSTGYMQSSPWGGSTLLKTTNEGYNWNETDPIATLNKWSHLFLNPDTGWCIGGGGSIIKTSNGGINWTLQASNVTNHLSSIYFVDAHTGYIVGNGGIILKTITGGLTSVNQTSSEIPSSFKLEQNYPNPFNPNTVIRYQLPVSSFISLKVYDHLGKAVAVLVNEKQNLGKYNYQFSPPRRINYQLPSGVYYYSLYMNGNIIDTKTMVLLK